MTIRITRLLERLLQVIQSGVMVSDAGECEREIDR